MAKVTLGEVAKEARETCKGDKSGFPTVGLEHITPEEIRLSNWNEGSDNTFTKRFHAGDILFGRRRAYLKKAAIAPFEGICSGDITVIRATPEKMEPRLLPFIIQNDEFFDYAVGRSAGSLSPRVKWEHLKNYEFDLPEMEKQRELADVLWSIEDTRTAYQELAKATEELVKSRFIEMFGDPVTNPHGWKKVPLSELAEIRIGPFGTLLHKEDYIEGGHPLVNPSHIHDGNIVTDDKLTISDEKYEELSAYHLFENDVVMGRRGEMGRCAVVPTSGLLCGTGSMIIRSLGEVRADFLQKIISFPSFKKTIEDMAVGQTMPNLNVPIVSRLEIIKPPSDVQDAYYDFVALADKSKSVLQQSIDNIQALKAALIKEYLAQ